MNKKKDINELLELTNRRILQLAIFIHNLSCHLFGEDQTEEFVQDSIESMKEIDNMPEDEKPYFDESLF